MAIGERIHMARRMVRKSQRALADEIGVSAMAISKYERDLDMPSSGVLIRLSRALGVKVEFFLRPVTVHLTAPEYRCRATLRKKEKDAMTALTQEWLERYLDIESLFDGSPKFARPEIDCRVATLDDLERVAVDLRRVWQLGLDAIDSLVEVIESKGIKVGTVDGPATFDALTLLANEQIPVIVIKRDLPGDRQRFNLAHELGHLLLDPAEDLDQEKAAHRFAGAFLVPAQSVVDELGPSRTTLDFVELHLLKHKYGLSMQAWTYRARDLNIISEAAAAQLWRVFRRQGWHREEPGDPVLPEEPGRLKRMVLRALAEDVISQSRASELLGVPLTRFWNPAAEQYDGFPSPVCP